MWFSSPSVKEDAAYFGDEDGIFYAVDIKNGKELWRFKTKGSRCYSPVVTSDTICFVSGSGENSCDDILYALDRNTGKKLWDKSVYKKN